MCGGPITQSPHFGVSILRRPCNYRRGRSVFPFTSVVRSGFTTKLFSQRGVGQVTIVIFTRAVKPDSKLYIINTGKNLFHNKSRNTVVMKPDLFYENPTPRGSVLLFSCEGGGEGGLCGVDGVRRCEVGLTVNEAGLGDWTVVSGLVCAGTKGALASRGAGCAMVGS